VNYYYNSQYRGEME